MHISWESHENLYESRNLNELDFDKIFDIFNEKNSKSELHYTQGEFVELLIEHKNLFGMSLGVGGGGGGGGGGET